MELKEQKFGIEIEMTGITRAKAAEVTAEYFGTRVKYLGTYYDTYAAIDTEGRQWNSAEKIEWEKDQCRERISDGDGKSHLSL